MKHRLRPLVLAIASVLLPGLGHAAVGRRRAAALFLVPTLLVGGAVVTWALTNGTYGVAATMVTPGALTLLFAANIMVAGWRTSAAVDAVGNADPGRLGAALAGLVIVIAVGVPHLIAADTIMAAETFLDETFAGIGQVAEADAGDTETPMPDPTEPPVTAPPSGASPAPSASSGPTPSPSPVIPPFPTDGGNGTLPRFGAAVPWERPGAIPWGSDGRFDLLLIGSDAGEGRWSRRNDVMLLVEVDVATGATAMIGIPRNLQDAPYPPGAARDASACGCQPGLINEMYVEATGRNPGLWPGKGAVKGIGAVRSVVHTLTGRPIDAVLIVDLLGVIRVVDAMGGVDINVPEEVIDDHYPDPVIHFPVKLDIKAGKQHFDGRTALAYARSRHMDSDYGRMDRQQTLLLAIRQQLGPAMILDAPALFGAAQGTAWTDLPRESLPALVELFGKAADAKVKQLRIVPPRYPSSMTAAWVNQIRDDIAALLPGTPAPQHVSVPRPVATPRPAPRPTPKPTPRPTAKPTNGPTPRPSDTPPAEPTQEPTPEPTPT